MKNLYTLALCLLCLPFYCQEKTSFEDFKTFTNEQFKIFNDTTLTKANDHAQRIEILNTVFSKYTSMAASDQEGLSGFPSTVYYNLACEYAKLNDTDTALSNLEKSVKGGYSNYSHMKVDSDLESLHSSTKFQDLVKQVQEKYDYTYILQEEANYIKEDTKNHPQWAYEEPNSEDLKRVREYFNLDSIVAGKNELDQITTLLKWLHDDIPHNGNLNAKSERDAISLYKYSKENNVGINCRMLSIILNECYLSLGIKSRFVTCLPKDRNDYDCHVINSVYSKTLDKWIWIDPTQNAYVKDENGSFLSISEVRKRLIENKPLVLNEDANWNNKVKATKESYLEQYMAKNLYRFQRPVTSKYTGDVAPYVCLYSSDHDKKEIIENDFITFDESYFWEE